MAKVKIISQIRSEVRDVKDCFTKFTFQSSALAAVAVWFIISNAAEKPWVVLAAIPVIILLMLVSRVGIFKYTTANRNLGYELHLDRLREYEQLNDPKVIARVERVKQIGWEESLRAWRVVQASIFARIYSVPQIEVERTGILGLFKLHYFLDPKLYKLKHKLSLKRKTDNERMEREPNLATLMNQGNSSDTPYEWWNQKELTLYWNAKKEDEKEKGTFQGEINYHTGNFLICMFTGLNIMQWTLFALLVSPLLPFFGDKIHLASDKKALLIVLSVLFGIVILIRQIRINRRREILEDELGSIHSCAITWAAVSIAHIMAAEGGPRPYYHYTQRLAILSRHTDESILPSLIGKYFLTGKSIVAKEVFTSFPILDRRSGDRRHTKLQPPPESERRNSERRAA